MTATIEARGSPTQISLMLLLSIFVAVAKVRLGHRYCSVALEIAHVIGLQSDVLVGSTMKRNHIRLSFDGHAQFSNLILDHCKNMKPSALIRRLSQPKVVYTTEDLAAILNNTNVWPVEIYHQHRPSYKFYIVMVSIHFQISI